VTPSEIRALLDQHHLRPSKALGQHFLADNNMAAHIVRLAGVQPGDQVLEIGPGLGSLTIALLDAGAHVRAVELDARLAGVLGDVVRGRGVDVVVADAQTVDWQELLRDHERWVMVSNLPYNVATPVVLRALEEAPAIKRFLVMVQREVGERLAARPGTKAYGAVTVKVAYHADAEVVGSVTPAVFVPRPKVESALVRLRRRSRPVEVRDPDQLFTLVRAGFATRRKMLRRALATELEESAFAQAGVDGDARAETLTLAQWVALADASSVGTRVDAFAKLTLSLHVTGRRADGYHDLDMLVVPVSEPHDEVSVQPAPKPSIRVSGAHTAEVPTDETNLALRAAYAVGANVAIDLRKGIPVGAGLGGGSADAAAVLTAVGGDDLERVAALLGADVPFALSSTGAMRVRGVGDELEPAPVPQLIIVIATPAFGCSTAEVYRAWDDLGGPVGETVEIESLPPLRNDLEPAAHHVEPRLAEFKRAVEDAARLPALLAGSGSSYAVVIPPGRSGDEVRTRVAAAVDGQVVVGHTVERGVRVRR
jgi:16S rRNA (adenine1518-N6/adenine1519-N6)-dimethyltransferase